MKEIVTALSAIQETGSFFAKSQVLVDALPLEVKELGLLKWPLTKKAIRQLIALAKPAHFGWRNKTLLDKNVRDVWEISPKDIRINQTVWNKVLNPVLETLKMELGLPGNAQLQASLHNLLIYEPGQFFHPHQDSEKYDGMIATMIVVLPCAHAGGSLIIDHQGIKKTIQSSRFSLDKLTFIAFYADCFHEVKPVKSGYRVALTYNLILENPIKQVIPVNATLGERDLMQALRDYFPDGECSADPDYRPSKCVYLLDHQYTQAGLSWRHLKNVDQLRATALKRAADQLNLDIYLTLADIQEIWNCEGDFDDHRGRWRNRRYDYDDDEGTVVAYSEESIQLIDLIEGNISLQHWLDRDGSTVNLDECSVYEDELGWTKPTDEFKPFQSEYEGWMGNYGNTLDRWYHRAAVVLWRKADHYPILFQINPSSVMQELIRSAELGTPRLPVSEIMGSLLSLWPKYMQRRSEDLALLSEVLQIADLVKNATLSGEILRHFSMKVLTPQSIKLCKPLIEIYGISWFLEILQAWAQPKERWEPIVKCSQISKITKILGSDSSYQPLINFLLEYQWRQLQKQYAENIKIESRVRLLEGLNARIQDFQELLQACRIAQDEALMMMVINHLLSDKIVYPALNLITMLDDCKTLGYEKLRQYIFSELQNEKELGLRQSDDWSICEKISCSCADCTILDQFLRSKVEKIKVWPLAQGRRQHIHQAINGLGIPVTHETEHTGSPHKLVLTKTELLHRQARERFTKIQKELSQLARKTG